jgi:cytidylate kinase
VSKHLPISVAIDGPAGAGKSTVSRLLAAKAGFELLDTGAMYRAYAWLDLQKNYGPELAMQISAHTFDFDMSSGKMYVECDGKDISEEIRTHNVTSHVSKVAADPDVRKIAVAQQQAFIAHELLEGKSVVLEGRDIGTTVLPNASIKFFLTASSIRRAERRAAEVRGDIAEIAQSIEVRDALDSSREVSPLTKASDAIEIDASDLDVNQVVEMMLKEIANLYEI